MLIPVSQDLDYDKKLAEAGEERYDSIDWYEYDIGFSDNETPGADHAKVLDVIERMWRGNWNSGNLITYRKNGSKKYKAENGEK